MLLAVLVSLLLWVVIVLVVVKLVDRLDGR